jgi:drug/metabolite transporter (DMT)-like permease
MQSRGNDRRALHADGLLLVTATIWGFAFVFQRLGMEHVGPFGFTGVRFALGCLVLLPLLPRPRYLGPPRLPGRGASHEARPPGFIAGAATPLGSFFSGPTLRDGVLAGLVLFGGASFQQVALVHTTASNAGFITGLYVVLVPILGIAAGQRPRAGTWIGALLAGFGLYLLSVTADLRLTPGDLLALIGAFFWAGHVQLIGWLSPRREPLAIAVVQYAVCSILSMIVSVLVEHNSLAAYRSALVPILYGGILSVGIAYTLQVVAQKHAKSAHAAIIMSLEAVFAALGGWMFLHERLTPRALTGCCLMLGGMLVSQLWRRPPAAQPGPALDA